MAVISDEPSVEVPALLITEQTGDKRALTLTGRALPYRPLAFSGDMRADFTAYAGNPIRTSQVLGAEEKPFECAGFWKDRFLDSAPGQAQQPVAYYQDGNSKLQTTLATAFDIVNLVDDMRRKGQEIVVQWGPVVRRGIFTHFEFKPHNLHDVEWLMRFEWVSQNDPPAKTVIPRDTDNANTQGSLASRIQNMKNLLATAQMLAAEQIDKYASQVAILENLVQEVADTTANVLETSMPIFDQTRRIAGILSSVSDRTVEMMDTISATPSVVVAVPTQDASIEGAILSVDLLNTQLSMNLRDMQFDALNAQYLLLKQVNPNILAVFVARANVDLRQVSTDYYGTQDEWRSLMLFNNLTSSDLVAGQTIFVPDLVRPLDGSQ